MIGTNEDDFERILQEALLDKSVTDTHISTAVGQGERRILMQIRDILSKKNAAVLDIKHDYLSTKADNEIDLESMQAELLERTQQIGDLQERITSLTAEMDRDAVRAQDAVNGLHQRVGAIVASLRDVQSNLKGEGTKVDMVKPVPAPSPVATADAKDGPSQPKASQGKVPVFSAVPPAEKKPG